MPPMQKKKVPNQVRIIGGDWKRTPLPVLEALGLRPTPDRVRETVFNWINHLLDAAWSDTQVLDLFAGSGALGFEAASRGAGKVTMIDANSAVVRQLEANREKLRATNIAIQRGDALATAQSLAGRGARFDLIFLDPPYQQGLLERALPLCRALLKEGGLVYAEAESPLAFDGWEVVRADKAGMVYFHLLQALPENEA
ncbi:16S rRNA (guanine(966)-N(2))-methyltransferase RsmD [Pseudoduganella sp. DS3]|uniref:16S rRNA (Guanine(966)-N(2))-methyltransferase RsmD n=1 Tax=Pseudoduganella guangdongensis TaxID=2692179 RepID=A0A6N9HCB9_9BURK|nr:16S rRNA (guanine(966)-N(2))-methyltransferase RsmD [Pseudoduganella guangdongensis]